MRRSFVAQCYPFSDGYNAFLSESGVAIGSREKVIVIVFSAASESSSVRRKEILPLDHCLGEYDDYYIQFLRLQTLYVKHYR